LFSLVLPEPRIKAASTLAEKQSKSGCISQFQSLRVLARVLHQITPVFSKEFRPTHPFNCGDFRSLEAPQPAKAPSVRKKELLFFLCFVAQ
jgi:hypothetical protein